MGVSRMPAARALGPASYGALFLVALPVALVAWARALDAQLELPAMRLPVWGALLAAAGSAVWISGVLEIVRRGDGLPMNAFPPARYVSSGIYALVAHPIYLGWTAACAGAALQTGSAAGLWIVTPAVALGCAALVLGWERHDLRRRFGERAIVRPWLALPRDESTAPRWSERVAVFVLVAAPWAIVHQAAAGRPAWPEAASVAVAALLAPSRATLRRFCIQGLGATVLFTLAGVAGRSADIVAACRVLWAVFAAETIAARSRAWAAAALVVLAGVVISLPATAGRGIGGRDVAWLAGLAAALRRPLATCGLVLAATERLANSWRAWRVGPARVISHGVIAGCAAGLGVLVIGALTGGASLPGVIVLALSTLVGAALWAQLIEGSPSLLRPFGYYGGVIGGLLGCAVLAAAGQPVAVLLAATGVAAPWVHAIGRLRCLVQGCCHGGITDPRFGIRVVNPHSRAVKLAHLGGQPIHATQLYSIGGNVVIGVILARMWIDAAPAWFIVGLYLLGAGLARFAEEGFRAEPQTIAWRGLPMYQYLAVLSVVAGAVLTTLGGPPVPATAALPGARVLLAALSLGAVYWFAMGVDFPESSRRFARLSG